jgi:hypothetical protein
MRIQAKKLKEVVLNKEKKIEDMQAQFKEYEAKIVQYEELLESKGVEID